MAGRAWQRLAKMCLLLSNIARVGDEGISQVGRPDRRSKREASIGLALCGVKRVDKDMSMALSLILEKCGNGFHIFLRSYELVMNFRRLNPFLKNNEGCLI